MQTEEKNCLRGLEAGQLWKVEHGYVYIVDLGRRLIQYKMLRNPNQKAVITKLIGMDALLNYLRHSEAELMEGVKGFNEQGDGEQGEFAPLHFTHSTLKPQFPLLRSQPT
jgi:hypothetical protein